MAERIASGEVFIEVNDRDALARLNKIRSEYHAAMDAIDREEANPEINADLSGLKDDVANAKRMLRDLEGQHATATLDADKKELARQVREARKLVKELDGQKAVVEIEVKGEENVRKAQEEVARATEKRIKAEEKQQREMDKLADDISRRNEQRVNKESRVRESLNRQRLRELTTAEREAHALERERNEVPQLEAAYARLQLRMEGLQRARRKARGNDKAQFMIDVDEREVVAKMDHLRNEVHRRIGRDPIHMEVMPSLSERAGRDLRYNLFKAGTVSGGLIAAGRELGHKTGEELAKGYRTAAQRGFRNVARDVTRSLGQSVMGGASNIGSKLMRGLSGLSDMTVRLGPFTTTIRGLIVGLSLLGPIIVDVVAALGSLVSVAGAAALGVGALGVGLIGGAVPALLGFGLVIRGVVKDFQNVQKAQKAYDDAVLKNGKNSDQAKKKLKELQHVMGGVSEDTAKAFGEWRKLGPAFTKLTRPGRASVFTAIGDGIKTATALMPMFARRTNEGLAVAQRGVSGWMKGLRSAAGRNALSEMMHNFNESLGPALHGLGQVGAYLGRIGQIASRALPQLFRNFDKWAQSLNSISTSKLTGQIENLIQKARDVGRFFMAAGRLIGTFFAGGVEAGDSMVNTMTDAMNRWTDFLKSTDGQNGLHDFFEQGVKGAQALFSLIAPIAASFVRWAEVLAPISRTFFEITGKISGFAASILSVTALRGPLTGLVTTLGLLWGVGKIGAATEAILGFSRALMGMAAAEGAVAAAGRGGALMKGASIVGSAVNGRRAAGAVAAEGATIAEDAGMVAAGRGASKARGEIGLLRKAAILAVPAIAGLGETSATIATGGLALVAAAAVYGGYKLLTMKDSSEKMNDALKKADSATQGYNQAIQAHANATVLAGASQRAYNHDVSNVIGLKKRLASLDAAGKKNTDAYRIAQDQLNQKLVERGQHEKDASHYMEAASKASRAETDLSQKSAKSHDILNKALDRQHDAQKRVDETKGNPYLRVGAQRDLAKATADVARAQQSYNGSLSAQQHAAGQAIVNQLNYQRALQGLIPIAGKAGTALAALSRQAGSQKLTKTIALKYQDPKDAGRVAASANKAVQSGVKPARVRLIVEGAKTAEDAIRKINSVKITPKRVAIMEKGGSEALAMVERITGKKIPTKEAHIIEKGGPAAIAMIQRILGIKLPVKTQNIHETGAAQVLSQLASINAKKIPNKTFAAILRDLASGKIGSVRALLNSLSDKTVTLTTIRREVIQRTGGNAGTGNRGQVKGSARGARAKGAAWNSVVGEGHDWKGAAEWMVDPIKGVFKKVTGPQLAKVTPGMSIIPTEARHRGRGREIFKEIADDLGLHSYAKGRKAKNPPATDKARTKARGEARATLKHKVKPTSYSTDNLKELDNVAAAQRAESNYRDQIQREAGLLEAKTPAPEDFLTQVGRDPQTGDPIYGINQSKINDWAGQLNAMAARFDELVRKIKETLAAVTVAMAKIGDPYGNDENTASVIGRTRHNRHILQTLIDGQNKILGNKKASKKERGLASERVKIYKQAQDDERSAAAAATSDWKSLDSERNEIGDTTRGRWAEAQDAANQYRSDAGAVQSTAESSMASANPKAEYTPPPEALTPLQAGQAALDALDAESALAAIGQGLNGQPPRSLDAINAAKTAGNQSIIDIARGMLSDSNPGNDAEAYAAISGAAGNINTIQTGAADAAASAGAQTGAFNSARYDLYKGFGNNFSMASTFGATSGGGGARPFMGPAPASPGFSGPAGGAGGGITFNQQFHQMPDPHTWSQGVAFELQAAL